MLDRSGRPHAAPGSPYAAQGLGPFGSQFRPTNPDQLFVDNAHNGTGLGTVLAFDDLPNGTLSPIGASPFADFQTAPCWQVISPDGQYLYALDTGSAEISSYAIARDGTLTLLSNTPVSSTPGVTGTDVALSADGQTLYLNMARSRCWGIRGARWFRDAAARLSCPGIGSRQHCRHHYELGRSAPQTPCGASRG